MKQGEESGATLWPSAQTLQRRQEGLSAEALRGEVQAAEERLELAPESEANRLTLVLTLLRQGRGPEAVPHCEWLVRHLLAEGQGSGRYPSAAPWGGPTPG